MDGDYGAQVTADLIKNFERGMDLILGIGDGDITIYIREEHGHTVAYSTAASAMRAMGCRM